MLNTVINIIEIILIGAAALIAWRYLRETITLREALQEQNSLLKEQVRLAQRAPDREQLPRKEETKQASPIDPIRQGRERLLEQDTRGRTPLFYAAEKGREEDVREMIFSLRGTGLSPTRLTLITTRDHAGLTAADVAQKNGHDEIARLLRAEQGRMEYFE